jgi:hypothetical protein
MLEVSRWAMRYSGLPWLENAECHGSKVSMKGDRVEIVIDAGSTTRTYEIQATRAGRRVEVTHGRSVVEVTEVTRSGTQVRTARFMATRVLALIEFPAAEAGRPATP